MRYDSVFKMPNSVNTLLIKYVQYIRFINNVFTEFSGFEKKNVLKKHEQRHEKIYLKTWIVAVNLNWRKFWSAIVLDG